MGSLYLSVAMVVYKSIVNSVVRKNVCSDSIIVCKLKAELVSILIVQVYMPALKYVVARVEEFYNKIEEILEEAGIVR